MQFSIPIEQKHLSNSSRPTPLFRIIGKGLGSRVPKERNTEMRTTDRTLNLGLATPSLSLTARVGLALSNVASIWRAIRNRNEIEYLNELNDTQLSDIGLTRQDLNAALTTSTFFGDPSGHLTNSARRCARLSAFSSFRG